MKIFKFGVAITLLGTIGIVYGDVVNGTNLTTIRNGISLAMMYMGFIMTLGSIVNHLEKPSTPLNLFDLDVIEERTKRQKLRYEQTGMLWGAEDCNAMLILIQMIRHNEKRTS